MARGKLSLGIVFYSGLLMMGLGRESIESTCSKARCMKSPSWQVRTQRPSFALLVCLHRRFCRKRRLRSSNKQTNKTKQSNTVKR